MKVAVTGAVGRMGSGIIKKILDENAAEIVAAIEMPNTPLAGKDVGEVNQIGNIGVKITGAEKLDETLKETQADVLIDFTIAKAAYETIKIATANHVNLIVGTTGLTDEQMDDIRDMVAESNVKAVITPNMAVGVNLFFKLLGDLAPILDGYDIEIIEAHHKHKKDAPSGTAMKAFNIIRESLNRPKDVVRHGREGIVGARTETEIGMHAIRGGEIVGEHTVLFAGEGERIEITHRAGTTDAFINGVMKSLNYMDQATPGTVHDMFDVLGIK